MNNKTQIDFFVIGAQKSGTTSLHYDLVRHPGIALPLEKEAPFFSDSSAYKKGLAWYIEQFYKHSKPGQILGGVTPQYMAYPGVAERMFDCCPGSKLICILRDPIERAKSHYKMRVRAFGERRSFEEVIESQLHQSALIESREYPTPENSYIVWGEYGRIISEFLQYFSRDQVLIVFMSDYATNRRSEVTKVLEYIGLDGRGGGDSDKVHNSSMSDRPHRFVAMLAGLSTNPMLRSIGGRFLSKRLKRQISFWSIVNRSNPNVGDINTDLSACLKGKLKRHFLSDLDHYHGFCDSQVPWESEYQSSLGEESDV